MIYLSMRRFHLTWRQLVFVMMLAAAAVVLAGCGGTVDTTLTVKKDGSGLRTITATVDSDDMEEIKGGAGTIDKLAKKNLPDGMAYKGHKKAGSDGTVFTFTIAFDSIEQYQKKAQSVLSAGNVVSEDAKIEYETSTPPFSDGTRYSENFTSEDLLAWLRLAIVDSGQAGDASEGNLTESGDTILSLAGKKHETSARISYGEIEKYGFSAVTVTTAGFGATGDDEGQYSRTIEFELSDANYSRDKKGYDKYFSSITPDGGKLEKPSDAEDVWTLKLPAGSPKQVSTWTDAALSTDGSRFTVATKQSPDDPLSFTTTIRDSATCEQVCQDGVTPTLQEVVPSEWSEQSPEGPEAGTVLVQAPSNADDSLELTHHLTLSSAAVDLTLDRKGHGEATLTVALPAEEAEQAGDAITDWIAGDVKGANPERHEDSGTVSYTLTVSADDPQAFSAQLAAAGFTSANGGDDKPTASVTQFEKSLARSSYAVRLDLALPERIRDGLTEETSLAWTVHAPKGAEIQNLASDQDPKPTVKDQDITAKDSPALTLRFDAVSDHTALLIIGVLGVLVVIVAAIAVTAFLLRKRIAGALHGAQSQTDGPSGGTEQ